MSNKHYKNRIRILNDYQATKDPNFKDFPLGTDRTWNYSHTKNTFLYVYDFYSEISVSFKAFVTSFSMDVSYNIKEDKEQIDGTTFYSGQPGFKYSIGLEVPAVSHNDARVNSSRIESMITMVGPTIDTREPLKEEKFVLLGNLVQNGRYNKDLKITTGKQIMEYGLPCFILNFKYDVDVDMGFFEDYSDGDYKMYPKNYKFNLELFSTSIEKVHKNSGGGETILRAVLANTNQRIGDTTLKHGEIDDKRGWPFGASTISLISEE